jgi:hypothetical protein
MSARVDRFSDNKLSLSFSPQNRFAREMVLEAKNRRFVEYHLERFFGKKIVLEALEHIDSPADDQQAAGRKPDAEGARGAGGAKPRAPKPRGADPALESIANDSPVIRRLIDEFDGEIFKEKK